MASKSNVHLQQQPSFPLSSPPHETLTAFKPVNGGAAFASNDTFLSPNPFGSSSSDDDSGSSSGQDEFHLERYSQETNRPGQSSQPNRKQSRRRRQQQVSQSKEEKRIRPGLNIVTDFSTQAKRSKTDGIVIDQVQSQRPQLGPRYATSIKSAKAEHMEHPPFEPFPEASVTSSSDQKSELSKRAIARQAVSKLQESQAARRRAAEESKTREIFSSNGQRKPTVKDQLETPVSATGISPGARSIVIGMSVPEDEVDAHRSAGVTHTYHESTPDTPAIVVTPAEEPESWKPSIFTKPRPSSSMYSATGVESQQSHPPPVPRIPSHLAQYKEQSQPIVGASIIRPDQRSEKVHQQYADSDEESLHGSPGELPRSSTESQERILPSDLQSRRHKSQGWWNLMLSPMLSRKGTLVEKGHDKSPETPPVPAIPADVRLSKSDVVSPLTSESPDTPRRLGLASARASVWSRWTTWERDRDGDKQLDLSDENQLDAEKPRDMLQDSTSIPSLPPVDFSKGLAAEYYHACAIEQLTGIPYFECENHSCADKSPQLHSIFDKQAAADAPLPNEASRDVAIGDGSDSQAPNTESERTETGDKLRTANSLKLDRGVSIRSEPEELSPNVRQADTATMVKARAVETPEVAQESQREQAGIEATQAETVPAREEPSAAAAQAPRQQRQYPNIAAVVPSSLQPPVLSPGPVSPGMQRTMTSEGAVPMTEMDHQQAQPRLLEQSFPRGQQAFGPTQPPITIHNHTFYSERSAFGNDANIGEARKEAMARLESVPPTREVDQSPKAARQEPSVTREVQPEEKEKTSFWSKLKKLLPKKKSKDTDESKNTEKKKKRRWTIIISIVLFFIVLACILLATFLTRTGTGTPIQSQWLNLTGFPPMPTGISTIARPDVVKQQSQCVAPNTMWSCALPKEDQFEVVPNSPDQPNFRFEVTFRNGTVPANMTVPVHDLKKRSVSELEERASDPFTNDLFTPNPSPPSRADQIFMGNTTDNITQPFQGEQTPFFITFIPVFPIDPSNATSSSSGNSKLRKRQSSNSSDTIPAPDVLDDGSAAPANLLPTEPFPFSQPIQLYNRGQADEHYGFYMYYDKAIFLHSTAPFNTSEFANNNGIDPDDTNGGSTRDQSKLRCTFSQTRFLVQMWTNPGFGATLLSPIDNGTNSTTEAEQKNSATDFSRPGSFPYPTTITIDRHGGNINKKAVYCYGIDSLQVIQTDVKTIVAELRSAGGTLINPAPGLVNTTDSGDDGFDQDAGGIDGGTGGCECSWQNWN